MNGIGIYVLANSSKIMEGNFQDNMLWGEGKIMWPDGKEYEGTFRKGKRYGFGVMKFADGGLYRGQW